MKRVKRLLRVALGGLGLSLALLLLLTVLEIIRLPDVRALLRSLPASTVLLDRDGNPLRYGLTADQRLAPRVDLRDVHPLLVEATIAAEDCRFRTHAGVDPRAAARALWLNVSRGRIVSGASTITMQVARLLRPLPRSLYGKFREAVLALRLEAALSKDEILCLYLNLSPYGGNVHGVEGAARRYFGRPASDLSLSEAALLAGLPQSPSRLRPDRHPERARARRDWVLDRMAALGKVPAAAAADARRSEVLVWNQPLPGAATHFSAWVLSRVAPGACVRTTLDPALQAMAEETVRTRLEELSPKGVREGALVVVETESGKIRALVGSPDFFSGGGRQVNGAGSLRSPGSLLKPFIYALALERGLIKPDTVLDDSPRHFRDGYAPRNFTGTFAGPVTVRDALVRSLNVPALDVLERVGLEAAIVRLRAFGLRSITRGASHHGLSLGVGGVEVTLLELVEAYAALGRMGRHRPLSFEEEDMAPSERVLSPRAAREIAGILEEAGWPRDEREGGLRLPRLALKTGTSFGLRDAWAVAFTPRFTVGVWLGNFDARPSDALVGQAAAAPAVLGLIRRLQGDGEGGWFAEEGPEQPTYDWPQEAPLLPASRLLWILPPDGATFVRHALPGGQKLRLLAETGSRGLFSFFADSRFLGRAASGVPLDWPLLPGTHRLRLVTPEGETEVRVVRVE